MQLLSPHPLPLGHLGPVPPVTSQRYFVLEDGILRYATTRQDVSQGLAGGDGRNRVPKCPGQAGGFRNPPEAHSSWVWALEQVSPLGLSSLLSESGRVRSPMCKATVILVRARRTGPSTKVPKEGELAPPPPPRPVLVLGRRN